MSHILICLSSPEEKRVDGGRKYNVQIKSLWPVKVFTLAELYFFAKLHNFIVRSELPEIKVCVALSN